MDATDLHEIDPNFEPQVRARSNTWPLRPTRELETQNSPGSTEEATVEGPQGVKDPLGLNTKKSGSRRNAWGNLSYADLITKAIQSSPEKRLTLSQIYDWMVQNVPYFKDKGDSTSSAGWKNSIRHNLSLHSRFMRIQNEGTGKSSWWVINPDAKPGKTPRRRAGSMETKSYEKKRGRIRKKIELRNALENGGTPSPGATEDYLDALGYGDFRSRASSNASSCGRLSPIHAMAEPDLHDNQVPPMSPIPWGSEVEGSPTLYHGGDNYSELVESLVDSMKLSSQEGMDLGSSLQDPYLSAVPGSQQDFNSPQPNFLDQSPSQDFNGPQSQQDFNSQQANFLEQETQYAHLRAPPPYPKQRQSQQQSQQQQPQAILSSLDRSQYTSQTFNNLRLSQAQSSPTRVNGYSDIYSEAVLSQQDAAGLSPVGLTGHGQLSVNTQPSHLSSPDRSQQGSPSPGAFSHLSPQTGQPQPALVNRQTLSPLTCQLSPQAPRQHQMSPVQQQQQQNPVSSLQQAQLQQATQASILREALTRGPQAFRAPVTTNTSPTYSSLGTLSPLGQVTSSSISNGGLLSLNSHLSPAGSPHHHPLTSTQQQQQQQPQHVGMSTIGFGDQSANIINNNSNTNGNNNHISSGGNMPIDIDMDLIAGLDYDMDQVIKQELSLEGNLDFNFDTGPAPTAGQNVVH